MKLPELKNKFRNKYSIRIVSGVLVVAMAGTMMYGASRTGNTATVTATSTVVENETNLTEDDEKELTEALKSSVKLNEVEIGKEETVYVIADNTGNATETIVSDHLINSENKKVLEDQSTLTDIENVKGDETFEQSGNKVTWQADGNDIFYQGTVTEKTPVTEKITYYLDGKEMKPEEIAGKSGKVTIRFDYENHEKVEKEVNGEKTEVCVPFVAVSGMILDDSFSNVEVTNGKVVADGNNNLVIGYTLPGLKDSLQVEDSDFDTEINIPEYFEMSADVENFSMDMTMTVVMNATNFVSTEGEGDLSSLDEVLDTLTDATSQLEDGSGELAEGLDTLKSSLGEFAEGITSLQDGIRSYTDGAKQVADGIGTLKSSTPALSDGIATLNSSAKSISDGIGTLNATLSAGMTAEEEAAYKNQAAATVAAQFAEGTDTYNYIYNQAVQGFQTAMSGNVETIYNGLCASELYTSLYNAAYESTLTAQFEANAGAMGITDVNTLTKAEYDTYRAQFEAGYGSTIAASVDAAVKEKIHGMAESMVGQISSQGADTTAKTVVGACKSAAESAAGEAVVTGINTTKATIAAKINETQSNGYSLVSGAAALAEGTNQLAQKVPELLKGVDELNTGASTLVSNNEALNDGAAKLNDATDQITDGVGKLNDGAHALADGVVTFNEEGINEIVNAYEGDAEPLINRIQAVLEAGSDYQTFTAISDDINGSVKFIYKTAPVK